MFKSTYLAYIIIGIIASLAMICTTIAAVYVETSTAIAVFGALAAIASPIIVGLLNQISSASRSQAISSKLDVQTETIREDVHQAKQEVKQDVKEKTEQVKQDLTDSLLVGAKGETGATGATGATGERGAKGERGTSG